MSKQDQSGVELARRMSNFSRALGVNETSRFSELTRGLTRMWAETSWLKEGRLMTDVASLGVWPLGGWAHLPGVCVRRALACRAALGPGGSRIYACLLCVQVSGPGPYLLSSRPISARTAPVPLLGPVARR